MIQLILDWTGSRAESVVPGWAKGKMRPPTTFAACDRRFWHGSTVVVKDVEDAYPDHDWLALDHDHAPENGSVVFTIVSTRDKHAWVLAKVEDEQADQR